MVFREDLVVKLADEFMERNPGTLLVSLVATQDAKLSVMRKIGSFTTSSAEFPPEEHADFSSCVLQVFEDEQQRAAMGIFCSQIARTALLHGAVFPENRPLWNITDRFGEYWIAECGIFLCQFFHAQFAPDAEP